jgi:anti-sigma factor RsiW
MMCSDVRKALSGLALGDLDAEPAAEVAAHLDSCADCRAEEAAIGRTLGALRRAAPVAASTERRSAAVSAMLRAHGDQAERLLVRRRPVAWIPLAAAAVFLLVVAAALNLRSGGTAFTVAKITGGAKRLDRDAGVWHPVLGGMTISVGDRVVTEPGCRVLLASGGAELFLDEDTSVDVVAPRRVTLDAGRVLAVVPPSDTMVITDMANAVRVSGRAELSLREVKGSVGGSLEVRGQKPRVPDPTTLVKKALVARVEQGEVALDGDRDQRLRASAGQQGTFTFWGQPETAPLQDSRVGTWADELNEER